MQNFIEQIVEGFDFGSLSTMDNIQPSFATTLSEQLFKDQILDKICSNFTKKNLTMSEDVGKFNDSMFNNFKPQYVIYEASQFGWQRDRIYLGASVSKNGVVDIVINSDYINFTSYLNNVYSVLNTNNFSTGTLYVARDSDASYSKILTLYSEGLDTDFKNMNFDNLPSSIKMVLKDGKISENYVTVYQMSDRTSIDDIVSFESYIDSLGVNTVVQYECSPRVNANDIKNVIEYIEENIYYTEVADADKILKDNKIKMTQKDCDRVSDLIKQNKDASSQANAITALTKAVSRFAWYCKLAHVNPAIFNALYKNEQYYFCIGNIGIYSPYSSDLRSLSFKNCAAFYNCAVYLGATNDIINAAYSKTFDESNNENAHRGLGEINYGPFTAFVLFIDNLKVPYEIGNHSSFGYYNRYQGSSYNGCYINIELLGNSFELSKSSQTYYVCFKDCEMFQWLKKNMSDDYTVSGMSAGYDKLITLQKLRTYILKYLKAKKSGTV